ncbi:hypothetical protein J2129_002788 [Methanofollis sp. W23]|nr:hypothetical protein [Methanofollis sp. W23]
MEHMEQKQVPLFTEVDLISIYTREDAIRDGLLVDVSEMGREAGFRIPVAVTRKLWDEYIVPDPRSVPYGQSVDGRLWDTLWMSHLAARCRPDTDRVQYSVQYKVIYIMKTAQRRGITLEMRVGAADPQGRPCITIMLPGED